MKLILAAVSSILLAANLAVAFPSEFPLGVTVSDGPSVQGAPVIYAADGQAHAVGLGGQILRSWDSPLDGTTLGYVRPLPNGNLLGLALTSRVSQSAVEFDQGGNLIWQFDNDGMFERFHHDVERLSNGNTLILCRKLVTILPISPLELKDDCLVEVDPAGNIVWQWRTYEHFNDFGFSARIADAGGDWAHANAASPIPDNDLGDPRFRPGNVVISYRFLNMVVIVDKPTGNIVWIADNLTIGQHHSHVIAKPLPGAGNILVFDNGLSNVNHNPGDVLARSHSRVLEINPLDQEIVDEYTASDSGFPDWWFYSHFISSAQRLPNGNTLICEGSNGRIFEVDAAGQLVWEFINPLFFSDPSGIQTNRVYRAEKAWFW
jgi:hypothetical protein